jgi:hypothetical protein
MAIGDKNHISETARHILYIQTEVSGFIEAQPKFHMWHTSAVSCVYKTAYPSENIQQAYLYLLHKRGAVPQNIDTFLCHIGPGSFTGTRIGVSFTNGLIMAHIYKQYHYELRTIHSDAPVLRLLDDLDQYTPQAFPATAFYSNNPYEKYV